MLIPSCSPCKLHCFTLFSMYGICTSKSPVFYRVTKQAYFFAVMGMMYHNRYIFGGQRKIFKPLQFCPCNGKQVTVPLHNTDAHLGLQLATSLGTLQHVRHRSLPHSSPAYISNYLYPPICHSLFSLIFIIGLKTFPLPPTLNPPVYQCWGSVTFFFGADPDLYL
jgi:hypothetical protein